MNGQKSLSGIILTPLRRCAKLLALLLFLFTLSVGVEAAVIPPASHPRVFVTKDKIPEIIERTKRAELQTAFTAQKNYAAKVIDCKLDTEKEHNYDENLLTYIKAKAFMYMTGLDKSCGAEAVEGMRDYLNTVKINNTNVTYTRRNKGEVIFTTALVYDWCYSLLSESDKKLFSDKAIELASSKTQATVYPNLFENESTVGGQAGEGCVLRDLLSLSIAIYDERPEVFEKVSDAILNKMAPSRKVFANSGLHPEGNSYGMTRYGYEADAVLMFDALGYPDIFGENFGYVPYKWIYDRRGDGIWMKEADDFISVTYDFLSYPRADIKPMLAASYLTGEEAFKRQWLRSFSAGGGSGNIYTFLFAPDVSNMDLKEEEMLPLSYKTNIPFSSITARTSWQSGLASDSAIVRMSMYEKNIASHMHADSGSFEIYYKGPLAVDGGVYEGEIGQWGSDYYMNYASRSVAHNLLTIYDPNEKYIYLGKTYLNDGGQRGVTTSSTVKTYDEFLSNSTTVSERKAIYSGPQKNTPDFSYIKGDLTAAYTDKIENYTRSMVFMDLKNDKFPAAFVVFDKVKASDATFKKSWLLHSINEPQISGNKITVTNDDRGYGGKLVNYSLLPDNQEIEKVEGDTISGTVYKNTVADNFYNEGGEWRVEISPEEKESEDVFLNAMYVTDAGEKQSIDALKTENQHFYGVGIYDRFVFFSKNGENVSENFTLDIQDNGFSESTVMICDIVNGEWNIKGDGVNIKAVSMAGEECIVFKVPEGVYTVSKSGEGQVQLFEEEDKREFGDFQVFYENEFIYLENETIYKNGKCFVEAGAIKELGATVLRSGASLSVKKNGREAVFYENSALYTLNGCEGELSEKPFVNENGFYVALDDLCSVIGMSISFDSAAQIAKLKKSEENVNIDGLMPKKVYVKEKYEGHPAQMAFDKNGTTWYRGRGKGSFILYDFGKYIDSDSVKIKFHSAGAREYKFSLEASKDGENFDTIGVYTSSKDSGIQSFEFKAECVRYVRIVSEAEYFSVCEMHVLGEEIEKIQIITLQDDKMHEKVAVVIPTEYKNGIIYINGNKYCDFDENTDTNFLEIPLRNIGQTGSISVKACAEYGGSEEFDEKVISLKSYKKTTIFEESFEEVETIPETANESFKAGNVQVSASDKSRFYIEDGKIKIVPTEVNSWSNASLTFQGKTYNGEFIEISFDMMAEGAQGQINLEFKNADGTAAEPTTATILDSSILHRRDTKHNINVLLDSKKQSFTVFVDGEVRKRGVLSHSGISFARLFIAAPETENMYYLIDNVKVCGYTLNEGLLFDEEVSETGEIITFSAKTNTEGKSVICALFTDDGNLYDIKSIPTDSGNIGVTFTKPQKGWFIKVFVWDSLRNMKTDYHSKVYR